LQNYTEAKENKNESEIESSHARETSSITESPNRVVCKKLRLHDVRPTTQRIIPKARLRIIRTEKLSERQKSFPGDETKHGTDQRRSSNR
jgi:hypothetical protein